jgi:hypothetical protein
MKNIWATCAAIILFAGLPIVSAGAQQSGPPAKPTQGGSTPSTNAGSAATPDSAASSQKVVLKVGTTQVTQSEMELLVSKLGSQARVVVARRGRRPLGEEYVKMLLLSQRAMDEHLDSSPAVRAELEHLRAQTLAELAYEDMSRKVQVSTDEVNQYFAGHRSDFETVKVREFTIRQRPKDSNDANRGLAPEVAKAKAQAIRKALLPGTDIDEVAATFAKPPNIALVDRNVRRLRHDEMIPALADATFALKEGGITEPVETPDTIYVVKVFGHEIPELKEVQEEIVGTIKQKKLDAEIDEMKKKAGVWMDEDYFSGRSLPTITRPIAHPPASVPPPKPQ